MFNKIIKIDCDGVLRDMLPAMCGIYTDYFDCLKPEDITDYDINKIFTKCKDPYKFFFDTHAKYIYLNSQKCEKAKEAMDLLHEKGYHIIIVSNQPTFENQLYTLQWLKDNEIYYDSICFTKEKQIIFGHIVIDDYANNLIQCSEEKKILIEAPYNKNENRFKKYKTLYEYAKSI